MPSSEGGCSPCDSVVVSVSECTIFPSKVNSGAAVESSLRLSVSDLPMLTCQYIQKGCLYRLPSVSGSGSGTSLNISLLKVSLSHALSFFPALAGRFSTDHSTGQISLVLSPSSGATFIHAVAPSLHLSDVLIPNSDVPIVVQRFFAFTDSPPLSYEGHSLPITSVQVTELADSFFVGVTVNHAAVDGTSLWNFFNSFAEISRRLLLHLHLHLHGGQEIDNISTISRPPQHRRDNVFRTEAVLRFPPGGPAATFAGDEAVRERIFHFSRDAISDLKKRANKLTPTSPETGTEMMGKVSNDTWRGTKETQTERERIISSFQSLCAQLWRCVTRARKLPQGKTTTFRMAVNCRHRVDPKMDPYYFGNAIQSIPTTAAAEEVISKDLRWSAELLRKNVAAHDDRRVREWVGNWEADPRCFPLGNFDGAMITMGSSPRFPMYDNDFGWGRPIAVRSGKANKFDGKISAFPGRQGDGSVDLEVVLNPDTMAALEKDPEFMHYVDSIDS